MDPTSTRCLGCAVPGRTLPLSSPVALLIFIDRSLYLGLSIEIPSPLYSVNWEGNPLPWRVEDEQGALLAPGEGPDLSSRPQRTIPGDPLAPWRSQPLFCCPDWSTGTPLLASRGAILSSRLNLTWPVKYLEVPPGAYCT